jgi:prepilin-type N-terminal cleavage/methylation domain-containing protein
MFRRFLSTAAMCLIAIAAIAKLIDLPAFLESLEHWVIVPNWAVVYIGVIVPCTELAISAAWLLGLGGRQLRTGAIGLMIVFTCAYVTEALVNRPPTCDCFGKWRAWKQWSNSVPWVVGRNALVVLCLAVGANNAFRLSASRESPRRVGRAGFTLLELVITIALIGLLIALIAPSFKSFGYAARDTKSLGNLRQHCQVVALYATSESDYLPCQVDPSATHTILRAGGDMEFLCAYFDIRYAWTVGMADGYYDGRWEHKSYYVPTNYSGTPWTYWYTVTAVARPEYWRAETRTIHGQFAGQLISNVTYPSAKGLYLDVFDGGRRTYTATGQDYWPIGFADGSARRASDKTVLAGYPRGDGELGVGRGRLGVGFPVIHTNDGVRGRDVK